MSRLCVSYSRAAPTASNTYATALTSTADALAAPSDIASMDSPLVTAALSRAGNLAAPPSFVVGVDLDGHWVAVETHGLGGGLFVSRDAALGWARSESCHRPDGVRLTSAPITLC